MNLSVPTHLIKKLREEKVDHPAFGGATRHYNDAAPVDVRADRLSEEVFKKLVAAAEKMVDKATGKAPSGISKLLQQIGMYFKINKNPEGVVVKRLDQMEGALINYIKKAPHRWLFRVDNDGIAMPYLVTDIDYTPRDRDTPAHISMDLTYSDGISHQSIGKHWELHEVMGKSLREILEKAGYYLESAEAVAEYEKSMERFGQFLPMVGEQFLGSGTGYGTTEDGDEDDSRSRRRGWGYGNASLTCEGEQARLVNDENLEKKRVSGFYGGADFWSNKRTEAEHDEAATTEDDDGNEVPGKIVIVPEGEFEVPVHPYLWMFNLREHHHVSVHVNNLEVYVYDETLINKLILPKTIKTMIGLLVTSVNDVMEDVIRGKTGGVITALLGLPGTGKTLTAEIMSESVKRPLYTVQCSQLGLTPEDLEKTLKKVLARAVRWRAMLLIDESDVYIRARGEDIEQNAIVGVFLRVLEYYRGILFLTSNRGTIIDDAVLSRCTAIIEYPVPTEEDLAKIWQVLAANYGVEIDAKQAKAWAKEFVGVSGRSVKNLLKLSRMYAKSNGEPITLTSLIELAQYVHITGESVAAKHGFKFRNAERTA